MPLRSRASSTRKQSFSADARGIKLRRRTPEEQIHVTKDSQQMLQPRGRVPMGNIEHLKSFPLSFQDTNYKIPEQWGSWSWYKVRAKRGERLKAYSWRNRIAITSLVLWFLKEHLQPKNRFSHLQKEWDMDTRQEKSASEYLRKNKIFSDHTYF